MLLARSLRDLDGDCDSEPVDFWIRNKATYDKLIPAVQRTFAIPASSAPVEKGFQPWEHCATATQSTHVWQTSVWTRFLKCNFVWFEFS